MSLKPEIKPVYECPGCGQTYKIHSRFLAHKCKAYKPAEKKAEQKQEVHFECDYCKTNYATERGLEGHRCETKERLDEVQSPLGQAAFLFYAKWMRATGKTIPPIATFTTSKYYKAFIRFAKFHKALRLPSIEVYMQVMKAKNIGPELWTHDAAYGIYLEHMEYHIDPNDSAKITSDTLEKLSSEYKCEISDVFDKSNKNEIIQLIRERRLSPWILLRSTRFKRFLSTCSETQQEMIEALIDGRYWTKKFNENPKVTKLMTMCARELGV